MRLSRITLSAISYHNGEPFSMPVSMKSSAVAGSCVETEGEDSRGLPDTATAIAMDTAINLSMSSGP